MEKQEMKNIRDLRVKDVYSKNIRTINKNENVQKAAILMTERKIGSIIVSDDKGLPVGIITGDDIIYKVVQFNKQPSKVRCEEIMSFPILTIELDQNLINAMRVMAKNKVKRLVVEGLDNKLEGIITASDIITHSPDYIEILQEHIEIVEGNIENASEKLSGYCQACGAWSDELMESEDGRFVCEDCL